MPPLVNSSDDHLDVEETSDEEDTTDEEWTGDLRRALLAAMRTN